MNALSESQQKAMSAPISSNQLIADLPTTTLPNRLSASGQSTNIIAEPSSSHGLIGDTTVQLQQPQSPYIIQAGTIIPSILINRD